MSCKQGHSHYWPTEGILTIERCETICQFCVFQGKHEVFSAKFAWFLRRHVEQVHCKKEYPNLIVAKGWTGAADGNNKNSRKEKKRNKRTTTVQPSQVTPEPLPVIESIEPYYPIMTSGASQCINPDILHDTTIFASTSTWSTAQSVRLSAEAVEKTPPPYPVDIVGAADVVVDGLNNLLSNVQATGALSDGEMLYVLETYAEAFKYGRMF